MLVKTEVPYQKLEKFNHRIITIYIMLTCFIDKMSHLFQIAKNIYNRKNIHVYLYDERIRRTLNFLQILL